MPGYGYMVIGGYGGYWWLWMVTPDYAWLYTWLCVDIHSYAWLFMVMGGYEWLYLAPSPPIIMYNVKKYSIVNTMSV